MYLTFFIVINNLALLTFFFFKLQPKKRRNVVFKVQRYHSVYEYPKEVIELSPSYSEPHLWDTSFEKFIEAQNAEPPTPQSHQADEHLFNEGIDGFMVSSSTRPFIHSSSQFHQSQCNTWPGDQNDFSWSQIQDLENQTESSSDSKMFQGSNYIEWPSHLISSTNNGNASLESGDRSDSGVGESVEFNNPESLSLGELRHAKATLKLPLGSISVAPLSVTLMDIETEDECTNSPNSQTNAFEEISESKPIHDIDEKEAILLDSDTILPTPSCTGSMDSLSSSNSSMSGSDQRSSKGHETNTIRRNNTNLTDATTLMLINESDLKRGNSDIIDLTNSKMMRHLSARLSDSTDEDSGIENLTRVSK